MVMKPTPMKPPSKAGGSIVGWFRVVGDAGGCSSGVGPEMVFSGCCHAFLSWLLGISPVFFFPWIFSHKWNIGSIDPLSRIIVSKNNANGRASIIHRFHNKMITA